MFEILAALLVNVLEHVMESTFINGFKPKVRAEARMMQPCGLAKIMELTQRVED